MPTTPSQPRSLPSPTDTVTITDTFLNSLVVLTVEMMSRLASPVIDNMSATSGVWFWIRNAAVDKGLGLNARLMSPAPPPSQLSVLFNSTGKKTSVVRQRQAGVQPIRKHEHREGLVVDQSDDGAAGQ